MTDGTFAEMGAIVEEQSDQESPSRELKAKRYKFSVDAFPKGMRVSVLPDEGLDEIVTGRVRGVVLDQYGRTWIEGSYKTPKGTTKDFFLFSDLYFAEMDIRANKQGS